MKGNFCLKYGIYCEHFVEWRKDTFEHGLKCDVKSKEECPFELNDVVENKKTRIKFFEK